MPLSCMFGREKKEHNVFLILIFFFLLILKWYCTYREKEIKKSDVEAWGLLHICTIKVRNFCRSSSFVSSTLPTIVIFHDFFITFHYIFFWVFYLFYSQANHLSTDNSCILTIISYNFWETGNVSALPHPHLPLWPRIFFLSVQYTESFQCHHPPQIFSNQVLSCLGLYCIQEQF